MTVGAVTAKSRPFAFAPGFPTEAFARRSTFVQTRSKAFKVVQFNGLNVIQRGKPQVVPRSGFVGRIPGTGYTAPYGPAFSRAAEKRALAKLVSKLVPKPGLLGLGFTLAPLAAMFWNRVVDPTGFPGWGNFPSGWTSNAGTVYPGKVIGTYTANGFDNADNWSSVARNLIDQSDGAPIPGFRYWGHYDANPEPGGGPGVDWPMASTLGLPDSATLTRSQLRTKYRQLPDLATLTQTQPWHPRNNILFTIDVTHREPIRIEQNAPRKPTREQKVRPRNIFVWYVMKKFANAGGEIKEWTDILAQASGYIRGSKLLPKELRNTGKETQAKLYWVVYITGFNSIDWEELAVLTLENEVEDLLFGFAGQLSRSAAQGLGMTVGPQTGLVM